MVTYHEDADVLYVGLVEGDPPVARTATLDDLRMIDYSSDGGVLGIEFDATVGIDLRDIPFRETVERLIGESGFSIKILA